MGLGKFRHEPLYELVMELLNDKRSDYQMVAETASDTVSIFRAQGALEAIKHLIYAMEEDEDETER